MAGPSEITVLLHRVSAGDSSAENELIPLVYAELRRIAASHLRKEPSDSLQPTALVHEVYLRLAQGESIPWKDRIHFYAVASRVMRRMLIDRARGKDAVKRGERALHVCFDHVPDISAKTYKAVEQLNDALDQLEILDPRQARIVEMRFYAGLSEQEIGEILEVSPRTVRREWTAAKAWLYGEMAP